MATLYRQYRPQNFTEILGQNYIKTILQNEILGSNIAHAYIFCGPRAVGKTTMARVFAKAVNCLNRKENEYDPCNTCDNCQNINAGRNLDIIEIDAASNTGVDNVRDNIISSSRVGSNNNHYKVFIIDEVHMLSISAFNALLKILEEPPVHVIFILCTTEIHKVPNTIISRCQRFDFKRISVSDMVKKLEYIVKQENIKIAKGVLESIAQHADGYLRDAESLLGQIIAISGKEITQEEADLVIPRSDLNEIVSLFEYLSKKDSGKAIQLINTLVDNGINLKNFTADVIELLRKIMISKINPALVTNLGLDFGEALEMRISEVSAKLELDQVINFIERFSQAMLEIKNSFIIQLPLELAIVELCLSSKTINTNSVPSSVPVPLSINSYSVKNIKVDSVVKPKDEKINVSSVSKESSNNSISNFSKEEIKKRWSEVLIKVKPFNHSLSFVLQSCEISDVANSCLNLTFKYKFHQDRINNPQIKSTLERILQEVYSASLSVIPLLNENLVLEGIEKVADSEAEVKIETKEESVDSDKKGDGGNNGMINNMLETFGGEIVN